MEPDFMNPPEDLDPFVQNQRIAKSVNFGNMLEAPNEGDWGVVLQEEYFDLVKSAGFTAVRIPVRWSTHAASTSPFSIDPTFMRRVEWAVEQALTRELAVIINIHHYEEIMEKPANHKARFLRMWEQVGRYFKDYSGDLIFEVLNEPHNALTQALWNDYLLEAIDVIRETNPGRTLIIGPGFWNNINSLAQLKLPEDDQNIIATVHFYSPFPFTHQGASWVDGADAWLGTTWTGSAEEQEAIRNELNTALTWAQANNRPIYVGEFGAYSRADDTSRARWTNFVTREFEKRDFSWGYWEFGAGFGVYDRTAGAWRQSLLDALLPPAVNSNP